MEAADSPLQDYARRASVIDYRLASSPSRGSADAAHALRLVARGCRAGRAHPPLADDTTADVVIVGGGYLGLWTAWQLKQLEPELDVVLLEAGLAATGRAGATAASCPRCGTTCRSSETASATAARSRSAAHPSARSTASGRGARRQGVDAWYRARRHAPGRDERGAARRLGRARRRLRRGRRRRGRRATRPRTRSRRAARHPPSWAALICGRRRTSSRRGWPSGCARR